NQLRRNLASPKLLVEVVLLKLLHLEGFKSLSRLAAESSGNVPAAKMPPSYTPSKQPETFRSPATSASPKPVASVSAAVASGGTVDFNEVQTIWPRVIDYVKTKKMSVGIFLSEAEPVEVADSTLTIGFAQEFQFHKEMLEKTVNRQLVEEAFEVTSGKKIRIQ